MLLRPWPILLLTVAHLAAPFVNAIFSAYVTEVPLSQFVSWQWHDSSFAKFAIFYFLFPAAGVLIYLCKKWSYYSYFALLFFAIWFNYQDWKSSPFLYDPLHVMAFFSINSLLIGYFLVPSVRKIYFNERVRWWETDVRYLVNIPGHISLYNDDMSVTVRNLSMGGAQIDVDGELTVGSLVELSFEMQESQLHIKAEVKNQRGFNYGLTFQHEATSFNGLKSFIENLVVPEHQDRDERPPLLESFLLWGRHLIHTGEGLFPSPDLVAATVPKRKKMKKTAAKTTKKKGTKKR